MSIATQFGIVAIVVFFWMNLLDTFLTGNHSSAPRPSKAGCDNALIVIRKFEAVRLKLDPQIEVISTHLVDV